MIVAARSKPGQSPDAKFGAENRLAMAVSTATLERQPNLRGA